MNEQDKNEFQWDLEDLLREFGDMPEEEQLAEPEEAEEPEQLVQAEESEEDIRIWEAEAHQALPEETPATAEAFGDTIRLGDVVQAVKQETSVDGDTIAFTPVGGDLEYELEEEPYVPPVQESKTEPYSEEWEPEYEQPIGDYIPQEPIVFRPKSRLQELKKKLIEGPEKRYYELTEMGLGKLQLAILACGAVSVVSALAMVFQTLGAVPEERMRFMVFGQFLALLLSAVLGSYQLMEGVSDLADRRFSLNTLLVFSLVACLADGILCLAQVRIPCCAPFSLNMTMALWQAYQKRNTELGQMDTMRKAVRLDSLAAHPEYFDGKTGFLRGEGQVEDFMETYRETPKPERILDRYAMIALFAALCIGVVAGVLHSLTMGIRFFSASLLVAVPSTMYITVSRPAAILERRLHKLGTVICGWQGVVGLSEKGTFPVLAEDIFPSGSVRMNGVKFYGSRNPDQVVAYGAAVIMADGSSIAPLFAQLLESRNGYHFEVQELRCYDNGGIGGVVNNEAVLVGTLSFMREMGVEMPEGARVSQAVYVAVDGMLGGVFAITYNKVKAAAVGLNTLCAYRGLTPVMTALDFMLTEEFVGKKFGVHTARIAFPGRKKREALRAVEPDEDAPVLALTTRDGLAGVAYGVTGARALHSACRVGMIVHILGGVLGLLIMLALTIVKAEWLLTPTNLLLFELVWMIPGLLISEWTRSV